MSARLQESDLLVERNKRGRATVYSQLEEFPDEEDFKEDFASSVTHDHKPIRRLNFLEEDKELMRRNLGSTALNLQRRIQDTRRNERYSLPPSIKQIENFNKSEAIVSLEQLKAYAISNAAVP
uniref:Uncharacterized protein n=1 Tax=Ditylenchus dipsaci TaxID=166011 RepID=A0A915EE80_9BILA